MYYFGMPFLKLSVTHGDVTSVHKPRAAKFAMSYRSDEKKFSQRKSALEYR